MFDLCEHVKNGFVVGVLHKPFQDVRIIVESIAYKLPNELRKLRICLAEPTPVCNAVCYICKFPGKHMVIVRENYILQYLAVQRGISVYGIA